MTASPSVRRHRNGDEPTALAAVQILRSTTWTLADAREFLADRHNYLIVAEIEGKPVGYLLGYKMMRLDGSRPMMCLYDLEVAQQYRRQGIGRMLVEEVRRHCEENNFLKMWVLTDEDNTAARALYEARGAEVQPGEPVLYWWRFNS